MTERNTPSMRGHGLYNIVSIRVDTWFELFRSLLLVEGQFQCALKTHTNIGLGWLHPLIPELKRIIAVADAGESECSAEAPNATRAIHRARSAPEWHSGAPSAADESL